jgi:hypothetical protein
METPHLQKLILPDKRNEVVRKERKSVLGREAANTQQHRSSLKQIARWTKPTGGRGPQGYLGGKDWDDRGSMPAQAKKLSRFYLKK